VTVADFGYSVYALGFLAPKDYNIIWHSNILALSVHDEGYFRNALCALNLISTFFWQESQNKGFYK
jgi:hypothetical protein